MKPPLGLQAAVPARRNVLAPGGGIRSHPHAPLAPPPLGAPWPAQVDWNTFAQKLGR